MDTTDVVNTDSHITSPVQFTNEPLSTAVEMLTVTVGSVKSDPDIMAEFLLNNPNTISAHVSPKREPPVTATK